MTITCLSTKDYIGRLNCGSVNFEAVTLGCNGLSLVVAVVMMVGEGLGWLHLIAALFMVLLVVQGHNVAPGFTNITGI